MPSSFRTRDGPGVKGCLRGANLEVGEADCIMDQNLRIGESR